MRKFRKEIKKGVDKGYLQVYNIGHEGKDVFNAAGLVPAIKGVLFFCRKKGSSKGDYIIMKTVKEYFGSLVFDDRVMKATLSDKVYASLKKRID